MNSNFYKKIYTILFLIIGLNLKLSAVDLAQYTPEDTTFFLQIADLEELEKQLSETGVGKFWENPQVEKFTSPIRKTQSIFIDGFLSMFELDQQKQKRLFNQQMALFVGDILPLGSGYTYEICMITLKGEAPESEYREYVKGLIEGSPERATRNVLEVNGTKIYQIKFPETVILVNNLVFSKEEFESFNDEYKERAIIKEQSFERNIQYAFVDDYFLISDGDDQTLSEIVHLIKSKSDQSMANLNIYKNIFQRHAPFSTARFFLNFKRYYEYLNIREDELGEENTLGKLGMDQLLGIGATLESRDSDLILHGDAYFSGLDRGIPAMLKSFRRNSMQSMEYVPANAMTFDTMGCEWQALWQQAFELLEPPIAQMVKAQLEMLKTSTQIDIDQDIIQNLSSEVAVFTIDTGDSVEPDLHQVSMIQINDQSSAESMIDKFLQFSGLQETMKLTTIEFLGHKIHTLQSEESLPVTRELPYWVTTENYLIIADKSEPLKETLRVFSGEKPAIGDNENFSKSRTLLPRDVSLFGWSDLNALDSLIQIILNDSTIKALLAPYLKTFIDPNAVPDGPLLSQYLESFVHGLRVTDDGLEAKIIINSK